MPDLTEMQRKAIQEQISRALENPAWARLVHNKISVQQTLESSQYKIIKDYWESKFNEMNLQLIAGPGKDERDQSERLRGAMLALKDVIGLSQYLDNYDNMQQKVTNSNDSNTSKAVQNKGAN